ncbi:hypothetical protein ACUNE0_11035 [Serratia sp. IR-2025]|uniref:hypothetical protein n=1 Tax=Serratia nevei TaxID=2703794 RepID=UPI0027D2C978|nr:hypothetical protein [Serratia nevei]MDR8480160.1 hypothetical protein [Serratia nevei]WMC77610.1 hypothetical protein O8I25_10865 [Serratia nevei]WMC83310.1 hypothetical protein O8I24_12475 [Serratia nevei]
MLSDENSASRQEHAAAPGTYGAERQTGGECTFIGAATPGQFGHPAEAGESESGCISLNHPILLMIFIREAIQFVSKVSTYETKHFLICIMIFPLSPSKRALNSA